MDDPKIQEKIIQSSPIGSKMMFHKDLEPSRWFKFSILEQLANVYCDVERAIDWRKKNNLEYSQKAFERALELLSLTIIDPKNKGAKLKELTRIREFMIDYFMYDNEYETSDEFWQQYFYGFAHAAAIARGR